MAKKKAPAAKKFVNPAAAVEPAPATQEGGPSLRRVMVLISEKDLQDMREHFAQGKAGNPTRHRLRPNNRAETVDRRPT
jgi:hypothetical protein